MFVIRDHEHVNAPMDRCFQLSTNLQLVADVLAMEPQPDKGFKAAGMIESGDRINWYGWKFGLPHVHVSHITRFERPAFFQDSMERGRFKRFEHDHQFTQVGDHTLMVDYIRFSMPMGFLGRLVGKYVVLPHMVKLLRTRLAILKRIAEGEEWRKYIAS